jgi:hypothetical protein
MKMPSLSRGHLLKSIKPLQALCNSLLGRGFLFSEQTNFDSEQS